MRVVVLGANGGIGEAVRHCLTVDRHEAILVGRNDALPGVDPTAVVCAQGDRTSIHDNYIATRDALYFYMQRGATIFVAMSGGGLGGTPSLEVDANYLAAKAGVASLIEWYAIKHPQLQFFCVAPGLTATKMTGYKGADPLIPAAFIVKLLSGKYGHLSGSLLAAQRDDLDTMQPMKLRRVACPKEGT